MLVYMYVAKNTKKKKKKKKNPDISACSSKQQHCTDENVKGVRI